MQARPTSYRVHVRRIIVAGLASDTLPDLRAAPRQRFTTVIVTCEGYCDEWWTALLAAGWLATWFPAPGDPQQVHWGLDVRRGQDQGGL